MNIRALTNQIVVDSLKPKEAKKAFESSADRDPQQNNDAYTKSEDNNFTEDEKEKALEYLKNHKGVKANNLSVSLEKQEEVYLVIVRDLKGEVVRRMSIFDLIHSYRSSLVTAGATTKGGLLNKAS